MARVIAIANQKGGVGKTTTAVNLGASLAASEQHTLIIDSDPQGNATSALGFAKDPARRTLYQALILGEPIERVTIDAQIDRLDLIPSDKNLVGAAVELISMENREYRLREAIQPLRDKYEYILIDCPPSLDILTVNALAASDSIMVPVQCEFLALEGVSELLDTLARLRRAINPSLAIEGILLTMYDDRTTLSKQVAADLGVSTLPALCLRAARHPGVRTVPLPGAHRYVFAVRYGDPPDPPAVKLLIDVLRAAVVPPQRKALDHLFTPVCSTSRPTSARSPQCLPPSCHQPSTRQTLSSPRSA